LGNKEYSERKGGKQMNKNETIVKTVQAYQELHRLSDSALAELLGIAPSLWSRLRAFKRNPGAKFFRGIGKIKELRMAMYEYFSSEDSKEEVKMKVTEGEITGAMVPKGTIYKMLGWKRHSKRSLYGHYFVDGKCQDCGLTKAKFDKRYK